MNKIRGEFNSFIYRPIGDRKSTEVEDADDELILTKITERGIESRPTNLKKGLLDRFVQRKGLAGEEKTSIRQFLEFATDSDLSWVNDEGLVLITSFILKTKNIELVRLILEGLVKTAEQAQAPKEVILKAMLDDRVIDCVAKMDAEILKKILDTKNGYIVGNILGIVSHESRFLQLGVSVWDKIMSFNKDVILIVLSVQGQGSVFQDPNNLEKLKIFENNKNFPLIIEQFVRNNGLFELDPNILKKVLNSESQEVIKRSCEILRSNEIRKMDFGLWEQIMRFQEDVILEILIGLSKNLRLLQPSEKKLLGKILKTLKENSETLKSKEMLLAKIFAAENGQEVDLLSKVMRFDKEVIPIVLAAQERGGAAFQNPSNLDQLKIFEKSKYFSLILQAFEKNNELFRMNFNILRDMLNSESHEVIERTFELLKFEEIRKIDPSLWEQIKNFEERDILVILTILNKNTRLLEPRERELLNEILRTLAQNRALMKPGYEKLLGKIFEGDYHEIKQELAWLNEIFKIGPNIFEMYKNICVSLDGKEGANFKSLVLPYLMKRQEQLSSGSGGPFLNLSRILKDLDAVKWNNLPMREKNIEDDDWIKLREDLKEKMQMYFPGNVHQQNLSDALRWFDQMPKTRDAQLALQIIRKRVASIIDYIKKQGPDPRLLSSDAMADEGVEIAKELVRILVEGGKETLCADAAAAALEEAEVFAIAFGFGGDYVINIIVNAWKRNIIPAKFVDPSKTESVEVQLAFLKLLNKPLGLESKTATMLHGIFGTTKDLSEIMRIVYGELTEDGLVGFAKDHPLMQPQFTANAQSLKEYVELLNSPEGLKFFPLEGDGEAAVESNLDKYTKTLQNLMSRATSVETLKKLKEDVDLYYYTDRDKLLEKYPEKGAILDHLVTIQFQKLTDNFKAEETKRILREKGFLNDTAEYEDPPISYWMQ